MRVRYALLFLLSRAYGDDAAHVEDGVAHTIEDTIYKVINTGLNAIDVAPVAADSYEYANDKCSISSTVTCELDGEKCENLIIPIEDCGLTDMTFTFKQCNNEVGNPLSLFKSSAKTQALVEMEEVKELSLDDLAPQTCREVSVVKTINTCKRFFSASLKLEGKRGPKTDGSDYCYAWDFLRIFVRRGPCEITASVAKCEVPRTKEQCEDIIVPPDQCNTEEPMTFTYEYCNNEPTPLKFRRQETIVLIEMDPQESLDLSDLPPGECRTFVATKPINTCKRFYSSSFKVEGWRGVGEEDYCFAYDFERIYTKRPGGGNENPDQEKCEVSSKVTCTVPSTGEACEDIIVPIEECKEDFEMIFEFEMCNYEAVQNVFLLGGEKTIALVEMIPVDGLESTSIISPGECRRHRELRKINTCKRFFSASLKVEGRRGDVFNDYCYAYDFYRSYIQRPVGGGGDGDGKCDITANIKCTVDETGEDCGDIVIPTAACETGVDMTFSFEFCNREAIDSVSFFKDTRSRIENIDIPGFSFSDLGPGECRRQYVPQQIDTCKKKFSAELLLEAKRGPLTDGTDYCFAYDFYRNYITRFERPSTGPGTTPSPALAPSNDDSCAVTSKVSCTILSTGQNCEDYVVPQGQCSQNFPITFEFEYCNFEVSRELDFFEDRVKALVEMVPVERLNLSNLPPGQCRRRIETREINTCKRFFSASLQIEAKKGPLSDGSDYCYAYDFLRIFLKKEVNPSTPSIGNVPTTAPNLLPTVDEQGTCSFSAGIKCTVVETGESCDNYEIALADCGPKSMTFAFEYCNLDPTNAVAFKDDLTVALIEMQDVELDVSNLGPGDCRTVFATRDINTCKNFFSASLKLEGKRGPKNDGSDYCYGWNFYRRYISRPRTIDFDSCIVTAEITCHDSSGVPCDQMIVNLDDCNEEEPVIFDFSYCNELDSMVVLREDKTFAKIDGAVVPSLDKSDLPAKPNGCRELNVPTTVNTCNSGFNAELRVRGESVFGKCFAGDFYQNNVKRPVPTAVPTPASTIPETPTVPETSPPTPSPTIPTVSTPPPTAEPTATKSSSPSVSVVPTVSVRPSATPSTCFITEPQRRARISAIIDTIVDPETLLDPLSPQSRAKTWLLDVDNYDVFCADACSRSGTDGGVTQRYTLALFYFAMNGNEWFDCGENSTGCTPQLNQPTDNVPTYSDNETWLSPVNECLWGGLACRTETNCLDRIEFGTYKKIT